MKINLQPFTRDDFDRLIQWIGSEEEMILWSGPFFTYPLDTAQLESYLQSGLQTPPVRKIYKAVVEASGEVVGHIELNNIDLRNQAGTLSKVLVGCSSDRGQGAGYQMVMGLLQVAFGQMHLHRMDLRVFDFNAAAIRCYQKAGFVIEGHLRDYRKVGDRYWSSYLMSILYPDWQASQTGGSR